VANSLQNIGSLHLEQGKHDEALEMYEEAIAINTRALGVDNEPCARVYYLMARAKHRSGDNAGAVQDAREAVRIYAKLGIDNQVSQNCAALLRRLE